jgi:Beta-lactamase enzyme family
LVVAVVTIQLLVWASAAPAGPAQRGSAALVPSRAQVQSAARWAASRQGVVSWALVTPSGRTVGRHGDRSYPSASVSKSLLLVAALRRFPRAAVPADLRRRLGPMIRISSNRAAHQVFRRLGGDRAFRDVARATRLRRLGVNGTWSELRISAGDIARFFLRASRAVPARHRSYFRALLGGIVAEQSWGIPSALRPKGWRVYFKGGWRGGRVVHQGGLAVRGGRRVALAVLTASNPTHVYGRGTIEGVARRLLTAPSA